jgi:putative ABC transport system permease protein
MSLLESIVASLQSILSNKLRSSLTILGIVIGVSAVVFLVSFGRGHQANITAIFESMGANAIYITSSSAGSSIAGISSTLTMEDAEALSDPKRAPSVVAVAAMIEQMGRATYENENTVASIMGVTPEIQDVMYYPVEDGYFISQHDVNRASDVAVLGNKTAENLFKDKNAIGESIRIDGRKFEVIGVLEAKGAFMAGMDSFIMIPLSTMQGRLSGATSTRGRPVQSIAVKTATAEDIPMATEEIKKILRDRHRIKPGDNDDFTIIDMQEIMKQMDQVMGISQIFLGFVGAISLVVGGIGIMNIMLVSVTERTREIGIRKAIGARRRDILRQFLVESAILSLSGGVIGILFASFGALLVSGINLGGYQVQAPISIDIVLIALTVAVGIGLASGSYPAFRAASLDPIESLRHE